MKSNQSAGGKGENIRKTKQNKTKKEKSESGNKENETKAENRREKVWGENCRGKNQNKEKKETKKEKNTNPSQSLHIAFFVNRNFFVAPLYNSSNETLRGKTTSSPRFCLLPPPPEAPPPPPKREPTETMEQ
jgi:hypothetical protein